MLTRTERRFVANPAEFSRSQVWTHRSRINKKIARTVDELKEIISKNDSLCLKLDKLGELSELLKTCQYTDRKQEKPSQDSSPQKNALLANFVDW